MSKNCDDLIFLAHHNELSLLLGYEEMKRITKDLPEFVLDKVLDFDLEEIFMYCAVNCIENPYISNYIKKIKHTATTKYMEGVWSIGLGALQLSRNFSRLYSGIILV